VSSEHIGHDDLGSHDEINTEDVACVIIDDSATDPENVNQARRSKYWNEWLLAIEEELASLTAKEVYEPVPCVPDGRRAVQSKWVLHIKRDKSNAISRFKARLVAKGFTQIPGQDFNHTFAPVARWDSIRSILAIATLNDLELRQLDVKTAYLNGPLDEEIYMKAPPGLDAPYWRLKKGLYGLRQAGRQWYLTLHDAYTSLNYKRCESDWSVYTRIRQSEITMCATSVDDILLATNGEETSNTATRELNSKFTLTDGGNAEWLLGCRITRWREKRVLKLDQEQFIIRILREFNMEYCNSTVTPCPKWRLTTDMCPVTDQEKETAAKLPYCAIVGKCMYLSTCTRPDISYAVRELARFMSNYGQRHYDAAKHLLRYLQGTRSRGVVYGDTPNPFPLFRAFADSDWAMSEGRRSVSGFVVECAGGPIAWSSKQQAIVALSSCEAEYLACAHCARQIVWLRNLFEELDYAQTRPTVLYCDNKGTVACTHDPHSHSQMKHIDIRAHFIRDCVNSRIIDVHHIPGVDNTADLLTKPLNKIIHAKWLKCLRMDEGQGGVLEA
jgi:Reverse transcriptase (RNA-dependent DNA polymerase)